MDVRMVTGDHAAIGKQVAGQIGMDQQILEVERIFKETSKDKNNEPVLKDECFDANGFAQVTPEDKFKIIQAFQNHDKITGMTGDGVNDAPALKQADVGIAVAASTDAARSAADLVLTMPGLGVIIHAIEEARRIFNRMISYSTFRITETMRVLLFMTLSILAFKFYPVTPIMIVLLAILNDIPVMTIAYDNVPTPKAPVRWRMKHVLTTATLLGIVGVISSFLLFWYLKTQAGFSNEIIQTMIFLKLLVAGHMTIFLTRNNSWLWKKPLPDLRMFLALEGTQIIGTLFAVYGWLIHPIGWAKAGIVWGYAIIWLLILNALKVIVVRSFHTKIK